MSSSTAAVRFVRRATAAGALLLPANAHIVQRAVDLLDAGAWDRSCDHVRATGDVSLVFFATSGLQQYRLLCATCFVTPARASGCGSCTRRPPPGLRLVVHVFAPHGFVLVGQACRYCRTATGGLASVSR